MLALHEKGLYYKEIAIRLNMPRHTVYNKLSRLGLKPRLDRPYQRRNQP